MLASHYSDFKSRWPHDYAFFSNSGVIVISSGYSYAHLEPSVDLRLDLSNFGSNFGTVVKIFGMPKTSRWHSRRTIFVTGSCNHLPLRKTIGKASCVFVTSSYLLRTCITIGTIGEILPYEGVTNLSRTSRWI